MSVGSVAAIRKDEAESDPVSPSLEAKAKAKGKAKASPQSPHAEAAASQVEPISPAPGKPIVDPNVEEAKTLSGIEAEMCAEELEEIDKHFDQLEKLQIEGRNGAGLGTPQRLTESSESQQAAAQARAPTSARDPDFDSIDSNELMERIKESLREAEDTDESPAPKGKPKDERERKPPPKKKSCCGCLPGKQKRSGSGKSGVREDYMLRPDQRDEVDDRDATFGVWQSMAPSRAITANFREMNKAKKALPKEETGLSAEQLMPNYETTDRHIKKLEAFLRAVERDPKRLMSHVERRRNQATDSAFVVF